MKTNNPFIDSLIETQTTVMNNWVDTTKKLQTAVTNGNIADEGQNIRTLEFVFKNDTLTFSDNSNEYTLPGEAVVYLKEMDEIKRSRAEAEKTEEILVNCNG